MVSVFLSPLLVPSTPSSPFVVPLASPNIAVIRFPLDWVIVIPEISPVLDDSRTNLSSMEE